MAYTVQELAIDHPSQEGWLAAGFDIPNDVQTSDLHERFLHTPENIAEIIGAVGLASIRSDSYRHMYEQMSVVNILDINVEQREIYKGLAGRAEKIADFIDWFSKTSNAYYTYRSTEEKRSKVGIEIGGKRQAGNWECTATLDNAIRSIPEAVSPDLGLSVKILEKPSQRGVAYRFEPLETDMSTRTFNFGLIRRRRAVADINAGERPRLCIFKESLALVVMGELDDYDQKTITDDVRANPEQNSFSSDGKNNTSAANAAGNAFSSAIKTSKGLTTDIVPISAHYVMVAQQPIANNATH